MSLTISSLELPGIMIIFFRFPCNFEIEVSPLIQITPVSTKKITVEEMGFFFQFPIKGEREERERSKKRAIEQPRAHPHEGHFFRGTSGRPVRTSTSKDNINIYPLWGRERSLEDTDTTMVIIDATNIKIAAQMAALQTLCS